MMVERSGFGFAQSMAQSAYHQRLVVGFGDMPAQNLARININHRGEVNKSSLKVNVSKISCPNYVWLDRTECFDLIRKYSYRFVLILWFKRVFSPSFKWF